MTFEEWWDNPEGCGATPDTYKGWMQSCHAAWNAGTEIREAEVAELKAWNSELVKHQDDLADMCDQLREDVKLLRDAIEYSGVAKSCQELADALAATESKT